MATSRSVTIRIPVALLSKIEERADEGKRSELIVQLLQKAIEETLEEQPQENTDRVTALELRVKNLENRLEEINQITLSQNVEAKQTSKEAALLDITNIPAEAKKINTAEMVKALKEFDPNGIWNKDKLKYYRLSRQKVGFWHEKGKLKFTYAGEDETANAHERHYWWIVTPELTKESQLKLQNF